MSKNKFFKKLLVAGLCALTATATVGTVVTVAGCKKDDDDKQQTQTQEYTVTFNLDGGKLNNQDTYSVKVKDGEKVAKPTNPTKSGYKFVKWIDPSDSTEYNFDSVVESDLTLKAVWEVDSTNPPPVTKDEYTVTIDLDGGTWEGQTLTDGKLVLKIEKDGDLTELYAELSKLTKTDYEYDKLVQKGQTTAYDWSEAITGNLELVVLWKVPHQHQQATTLSKDANGHWYKCVAEGCDDVDAVYEKSVHHDANNDGICDDECGHDISATLTGTNVKFKELVDAAADIENSTTLVLANTFLENKTLTEFGNWGTAGLTQGHKSTTSTGEYVEIKDNKANLVTDTAGATYLYADFGDVSASVVKGYFEISGVSGTNTYTPVQFIHAADNTEPIGLRSGSKWGYRLAGTNQSATAGTWANGGKVYFEYNTSTKHITVTVDGTTLVDNVALANGIDGIKFSSGDSNVATYSVNNIVVVKTPIDVTEYKNTLKADVAAVEAKLPTGLQNSEAKTTFDAAIENAATTETCKTVYDTYYAAVLSAYKTQVISAAETEYPASDYTKDENKTAYETAMTNGKAAVNAATTVEAVLEASEEWGTVLGELHPNDYYNNAAATVTISDGTNTWTLSGVRVTDEVTEDMLKAKVVVPNGKSIEGFYSDSDCTNALVLPMTLSAESTTVYVKIVELTLTNEQYLCKDMTVETWDAEHTLIEGVASITASTSKTVAVDASGKTVGSLGSSTHRIKLGGTGSANERSIKLTLKAGATIKVYAMSGSSKENRNLALYDASYQSLNQSQATALSGDPAECVFTVTEAGTYYIGSASGGINIYGLLINYTTV